MGENNPALKTLKRRKSRIVKIGNIFIGGNMPIAIQAMTKIKTAHIEEVLKQIKELEKAGARIIRLAIKDNEDALAIRQIKRVIKSPLVGDIHFDYRLAIRAIENGIDKIRLNPGNIRKKLEIKKIVELAKKNNIPIRVGLNSGSVKFIKNNSNLKNIVEVMLKEARDYLKFLESMNFYDTVISLKTSHPESTIEAYERMSKLCDYPFHLGLTATGTPLCGVVASSIVLGVLLRQGIGDTIRVSLTDSAIEEVKVAGYILQSLGLCKLGIQIISCPVCGRCEVDLVKIVKELDIQLSTPNYQLSASPIKLAVMGCMVNGPGEASHADLGVAFGKKDGVLFKKGQIIKKITLKDCVGVLLKEIKNLN
ncbi:MAG: flavodoxin-dependent (E)-4-hydroxy-3-methylbut-2-enyl-diphosphate synthase [Candidatus Omnitrophica bacterium]|nr:flavodoxin-dependent (E)-4-hydroxy-3-methylbut-2-enyl-diphosphate synthase [Candidatus Omnitrophota bacterium]